VLTNAVLSAAKLMLLDIRGDHRKSGIALIDVPP
jgi:hypothetical protein